MIIEKKGTRVSLEFEIKELHIALTSNCRKFIQIFGNYEQSETHELLFPPEPGQNKIRLQAIIFPLQENQIKLCAFVLTHNGMKNSGFLTFDVYNFIHNDEGEVTMPLQNCFDKKAIIRFRCDYKKGITDQGSISVPERSGRSRDLGIKKFRNLGLNLKASKKESEYSDKKNYVNSVSLNKSFNPKHPSPVDSNEEYTLQIRGFTPLRKDQKSSVEPLKSSNFVFKNLETKILPPRANRHEKVDDVIWKHLRDARRLKNSEEKKEKEGFSKTYNPKMKPVKDKNDIFLCAEYEDMGADLKTINSNRFHEGDLFMTQNSKRSVTSQNMESESVLKNKLDSKQSLKMPKSTPMYLLAKQRLKQSKKQKIKDFNPFDQDLNLSKDFSVDLDIEKELRDREELPNPKKPYFSILEKEKINLLEKEELRNNEKKLNELEEQLNNEKDTNSIIHNELKLKEGRISELEFQNNDLLQEIHDLNQLNENLNQDLRKIEGNLLSKIEELKVIEENDRIREVEIEQEKAVFSDQIRKLKLMLEELHENTENPAMERNTGRSDTIFGDNGSLIINQDLIYNQEEIQRLNDVIANLKTRLETRNNIAESFMSSSSAFLKIGQEEDNNNKVLTSIDNSHLASYNFAKNQPSREELYSELKAIKKKNELMIEEKQDFQEKIEILENKLDYQKKSYLQQLEDKEFFFKDCEKKLHEEIKKLKKSIEEEQEKIEIANYETEVLEEKIVGLNKQIEEFCEEKKGARKKNEILQLQVDSLLDSEDKLKLEISSISMEKQALHEKIEVSFEENSKKIKIINFNLIEAIEEKEKYCKEKLMLEQVNFELAAKNALYHNQNKEGIEILHNLIDKINCEGNLESFASDKREEGFDDILDQIKGTSLVISEFLKQISQQESDKTSSQKLTIETLEAKLEGLSTQNAELSEKVKSLQKELSKERQNTEEKQRELQNLSEDYNFSSKKLQKEFENEKNNINLELQQQINNLSRQTSENEDLKIQIQEIKLEISKMQNDLQLLTDENRSITEKNDFKNEENQNLQKNIKKLNEKLEEYENKILEAIVDEKIVNLKQFEFEQIYSFRNESNSNLADLKKQSFLTQLSDQKEIIADKKIQIRKMYNRIFELIQEKSNYADILKEKELWIEEAQDKVNLISESKNKSFEAHSFAMVELEQKIKDLSLKIQQEIEEKEQLNLEIESLSQKLKNQQVDFEKSMNALKNECENQKNENKALKEASREICELELIFSQQQEDYKKEILEKAENEKLEIVKQNEEIFQKKLDVTVNQLTNEIQIQKNENLDLKKKLQALQTEKESLILDFETLEEKESNLSNKSQIVNKEKANLQKQCDSAEKRIILLENEIKALENQKNELQELVQSLESVKSDNNNLQSALNLAEEEKNILNNRITQKESIFNKLQDYQKTETDKLNKAYSEIEELHTSKNTISLQLKNSIHEQKIIKNECDSIKSEKERLEKQLHKIEEQVKAFKDEESLLIEKNRDLEVSLRNKSEEINKLKEKDKNSEQKAQQLEELIKQHSQQRTETNSQIKILETEKQKMSDQYSESLAENEELENKSKKLQSEFDQIKKRFDDLKKNFDELNSGKREAESSIFEIENKFQRKSDQVKLLQSQIVMLSEERVQHQEQVSEIKSQDSERMHQIIQLKKENSQFEKQHQKYVNDLEELRHKFEDSEASNAELKDQIKLLLEKNTKVDKMIAGKTHSEEQAAILIEDLNQRIEEFENEKMHLIEENEMNVMKLKQELHMKLNNCQKENVL